MDDGFLIVPRLLPDESCHALAEALADALTRHGGPSPNLRHLLRDVPAVATLARSRTLLDLVQPHLPGPAFPVRGLFFDKVPGANWSVAWHQDPAIAVAERRELPGFTGWSLKDGVWHVHPPAPVLAQMITVRLHLDDCPAENGALQVIPGSHQSGRLDDTAIEALRARTPAVTCAVPRGGALLMRPLLLHSSRPSTHPGHRRVVHLEYAGLPLPDGLRWNEPLP